MKLENVISLTGDLISQTLGKEYMEGLGKLSEISADKLIDIGRDIADVQNTRENFTKACLSLMAKMEIESAAYVSDMKSLYVDRIDFGWFIERVKFDLADIVEDPSYTVANGKSYADIEHTFYQPKVSVKIFDEAKPSMVRISFQRDTIKEAFRSFDELDRFLSGIQEAVHNTLEVEYQVLAHTLASSAVAVSNKATNTAVHLLTEAKAEGIVTEDTTAEQAINNADFLSYALERIAETREYMKTISTAFNNKNLAMFTSSDRNKLMLLTKFANKAKFKVRANTFNEALIGVGDFENVNAWQAIVADDSTYFSFKTASSIKLAADANNKLGIGTEAVDLPYCIGLAFDRKSLGIYGYDTEVTSSNTGSARFWTNFFHKNNNYVLDSDYNIVAFMVD